MQRMTLSTHAQRALQVKADLNYVRTSHFSLQGRIRRTKARLEYQWKALEVARENDDLDRVMRIEKMADLIEAELNTALAELRLLSARNNDLLRQREELLYAAL